ncbi:MAG: CehA/McbA family metallohydrolase [Candidatus Omnitrophica bacterium]|nr:CehA/McbA family metallohydrolase [Candidatus Omnitrophota bacterium]
MPWLLPHVPRPTGTEPVGIDDGYNDYTGTLHVHSKPYSHDAYSPITRAIDVAQRQGLNYLLLTEHNNLRALRDGHEGMHGRTLVMIGEEVSTRAGHYIGLDITREPERDQPVQAIIDDINQQGGFGFIAHPYWKKSRWKDWNVTGFTGLEIYNTVHDAFEENLARVVGWAIAVPADTVYQSILDRPYDALSTWDRLLQHGKVVGIGGCDGHDHRFGDWKFAPYELVYMMVRTHLLAHELTKAALYDALRSGHCYVGMDIISDTTGFTFLAAKNRRVLAIMGDEVSFADGLTLHVYLPSPGRINLYKDGRIVAAAQQQQNWSYAVPEPGVYRVEVNHGTFPWIFSNPIYVRPAPPPTVTEQLSAPVKEVLKVPGEVLHTVSTAIDSAIKPPSSEAAAPAQASTTDDTTQPVSP